jgi:hypothetical protein
MENTIDCFRGITRDNAKCQHSECVSGHIPSVMPYNEICKHGDLDKIASVKEIQTWIMDKNLNNEEMNALLSGLFILCGGCTCKFSWEILNFFGDLLAYTPQEKFEILIENWTIKQYLNELPGLWGREEIIKTRLLDLSSKGDRKRIRQLISIISQIYNYVYGDSVPYVFNIKY